MAITPRATGNKDRAKFWDLPNSSSADKPRDSFVGSPESSDPRQCNDPVAQAADDARPEVEYSAGFTGESSEPSGSEPPRSDGLATPRDVLRALQYGLDLVQHGAALVAGPGHLRLANRMASTILAKKDGIAISANGLVADRAADTRVLHKLLQDAINSPEGGEPVESPLTLQRKKARHALIVRVVPGPGLDCWPHAESRPALLKLYDQDLGLVVDERALISLYGLTKGEAVLAARLAQGKSIEEAADELFISAHTARTHLKRIFMKTDTHRQTELVVRMLLTVL
ncbi:MAG TPA: helix-turn-helix transcriptional regulator [Candidatus Sulfotelmatobacter sp.]|jgi:DNA-binding CsgD family transcriptional regulator